MPEGGSWAGGDLVAALRAAVVHLEAHVDEINALNVFPVPDGDTGSNMLATVRSALVDAERVSGQSADRVVEAMSTGALMGARGNSGVIASQIFRGMADALRGRRRVNGPDLARALTEGSKAAYAAVGQPVEGTILTVARDAAEAANLASASEDAIEPVLAAAVVAAGVSVARTPSLLPILHDAGVVDAGGQGLYRFLEGALRHARGEVPESVDGAVASPSWPRPTAHDVDGRYGYETEFMVDAWPAQPLDQARIRSQLEAIGESVLVAGDAQRLKVHVHNQRPDSILAYGLGLGRLSRITVENLDDEAGHVREVAAAPPALLEAESAGPAVVAVVAGAGMARLFESLGVDQVLAGGQSANPSIGELLRVARSARSREVLLLPNNANARLAAEHAAAICRDKRIVVVPTRNAAEGIAAVLRFDRRTDATSNAGRMAEAARSIQTLIVTNAVRDTRVGGKRIRTGETMVLDPDDGVVASDADAEMAIVAGIRSLRPGIGLVTLFYGDGVDRAEAEALGRHIGQILDDVEVEVHDGGQPHYRYLISAD